MKAISATMSDVAVLGVGGDSLVSSNVAAFKRELEALGRDTNRVVVDLSEVQFIDSAGCGALLQFHKHFQGKGGGMKVCCVSHSVRALFELVRMQRVLDIYPTSEQAVQALRLG
jgi:anti-sigma B factor antagonist